MMTAVWFFLLGMSVFGLGIGIGWCMRGSVKEEEALHMRTILDKLEKARWKLDDLTEKLSKGK